MDSAASSGTFVDFYKTAWRQSSEDASYYVLLAGNVLVHGVEKPGSQKFLVCFLICSNKYDFFINTTDGKTFYTALIVGRNNVSDSHFFESDTFRAVTFESLYTIQKFVAAFCTVIALLAIVK